MAQVPAVCQRLEAQLASLNRSADDPARADQMRRYDEAINKNQFELDRLNSQARQLDCVSSGFFSIFQSPSQQCTAITRQIEQMRANLDRMRGEMQQAGGNLDRAGQRQSILNALAGNNCGPQYRSAANAGGGRSFLDQLFGGNGPDGGIVSNAPDGAPSGTYRTICVRTCDGYYFPVSYATNASRFQQDEQTCQRSCPAAQVSLYTYRNPGEDVAQSVSLGGQTYSSLPTAFKYRHEYDAACSCRQPGQSWADALKQINDSSVEQGDIVVTQERARQMSLPRDARGRVIASPKSGSSAAGRTGDAGASSEPADTQKPGMRSVGPQFVAPR